MGSGQGVEVTLPGSPWGMQRNQGLAAPCPTSSSLASWLRGEAFQKAPTLGVMAPGMAPAPQGPVLTPTTSHRTTHLGRGTGPFSLVAGGPAFL